MKAYVKVGRALSRAMDRVERALVQYAPFGVEFVNTPAEAEMVVLHVIGYPETAEAIEECRRSGRKYALMQYCLRTTQRPSTLDWMPLWSRATAVWSYYDLRAACREDGVAPGRAPFYYAPLGVDSAVFMADQTVAKTHLMLTSGYIAEHEGARAAAVAAERTRGRNIHLGPSDLGLGPYVDCVLNVSDQQLARFYQRCEFVAGLRRIEGFELPAAEGVRCGARPVMFDRPHYRRWFDGLAEFVEEGTDEQLTEDLERLFRTGAREVTRAEMAEARRRFDWAELVDCFWAKALGREEKQEKYA